MGIPAGISYNYGIKYQMIQNELDQYQERNPYQISSGHHGGPIFAQGSGTGTLVGGNIAALKTPGTQVQSIS